MSDDTAKRVLHQLRTAPDQPISERDAREVCLALLDLCLDEPNTVYRDAPIQVCGDIHGQFHDLLELFKVGNSPQDETKVSYVFMGDYVDRGYQGLETLLYLFCLKVLFPGRMVLLRGNHESRRVTEIYGFYDECITKFGSAEVWRGCCEAFDSLPLACLIDQRVLCVHGGLSPQLSSLASIDSLDRVAEIPLEGPISDLMWSDPEEGLTAKWAISPRGGGYLFGKEAAEEFMHKNALQLILRSHQLVQKGYWEYFDKKVVTLWSAPNYCYRCGNDAVIGRVQTAGDAATISYASFPAANHQMEQANRLKAQYFL